MILSIQTAIINGNFRAVRVGLQRAAAIDFALGRGGLDSGGRVV